jgi:membrane protein DedA with SNARE-associated domain
MLMSPIDATHLVDTYGYPLVFVGSILEGETILVLAGVAAHLGYLTLWKVVCVAALGGFVGDQFYFFLGRRKGLAVLDRFPAAKKVAPKVDALVVRYKLLAVPLLRFAYGVRTVGPVIVGASSLPAWQFVVLNLLGALLWAILVGGAGYYFGRAVVAALGRAQHVEMLAFAAALVLTPLALWVYRSRRHRSAARNGNSVG